MSNYREVTGLSVASLNGFLLPLTDVSSFRWISIHLIGSSFQGTVQYQGSNDGINFKTVTMFDTTLINAFTQSVNAVNIFHHGPLFFHFFQIQATAYTSGSLAAIIDFYETPPSYLTNSITLNAGTNTIGNVGELAIPTGATQQNPSAQATNAAAVATLTGVAAKSTYLTGLEYSMSAVPAAATTLTITGTITGTQTYEIPVLLTAPQSIQFIAALQSSAVNTNIVVTLGALGAAVIGSVNAHGYTL